MTLPPIHLVVMQPAGYVHGLGLLDQARYFRYQFRRAGASVSLAKNRLCEGAVNFVFGAHLGFPAELQRRHACIFVNLEQLGHQGAQVQPEYVQLLRQSAVVDYDAANVASYATDAADVPLVPFLHAPYLDDGTALPLESRTIDLLFVGSLNERRRAFIERVESTGAQVTLFDRPLYGPERDHFIRHAKAVLNCHFYEASRFEQARAFHCLSLGTPVISERTAATSAPPAFDDAVTWLAHDGVEAYFAGQFKTPAFFDAARRQLDHFRRQDAFEPYAELLAFAVGYHQAWRRTRTADAWRPTLINLGSGKDYRVGWLNIDVIARAQPDLLLDLAQPVDWPIERPTRHGGRVRLEPGSVELVYANNVLEHVPDLPTLMSNVLALLKDGGRFEIEVPYEYSPTAWQDPTHLRALNENSWLYYTDWFWYLGWFEHRFTLQQFQWLDLHLQPCDKALAAFMRVSLAKVATTAHERTLARAMQPDFGGIDDDKQPAGVPAGEAAASSLPA